MASISYAADYGPLIPKWLSLNKVIVVPVLCGLPIVARNKFLFPFVNKNHYLVLVSYY